MKFSSIQTFYSPGGGQGEMIEWSRLEWTLDYLTKEEWETRPQFTTQPEGHPINRVDLDPYFQRPYVWTEDQQAAYVEYILRNGTSGRTIYFNRGPWQKWHRAGKIVREGYAYPVLVDGKQRIEAVRAFLRNEVAIFDGLLYEDFEDSLPFHCCFYFVHGNLSTRADVLQWYLDLNRGGVVHTDEELGRVAVLLEVERQKR